MGKNVQQPDYKKEKKYITTCIFRLKSEPAALYKSLGGFATNQVNMTKLESFSVKNTFAQTNFYLDFEGHLEEKSVQNAMEELGFHTESLDILAFMKHQILDKISPQKQFYSCSNQKYLGIINLRLASGDVSLTRSDLKRSSRSENYSGCCLPLKMKHYKILALKYRPQTFKDLIGQEVLAKTITNAIKLGRTPNAYLLTGIRGVGKTTTARLIAKALNCQNNNCDPNNFCDSCKEIANSIT